MVALGLLNIVNLILCANNIVAYRKYSARIVTPVNEQSGGVSNQNVPNGNSVMFPSSTSSPITSGPTPTAEALTSPANGIFGISFPTNITIFINITSGSGFVLPTSPPMPTLSPTTESTTTLPSTSAIPSTPEQIDNSSSAIPSTPEQIDNSSSAIPSTPEQIDSSSSAIPSTPEQIDSSSSAIPSTPEQIDSSSSTIPSTPEQIDSTPPPTTSPVSDATPDINAVPENVNVTLPDEQNDNDNIAGQQSSPIVQNKMIFEEKCEEYYSMGNRKTRKAQVQVFIVGGTNSRPKEFPHMAALGYGKDTKKEWLCGGSLVSENYVVTAAHCLSSNILGDVQLVRLGTTNLQVETSESADYSVIKRIPHPDYIKDEQYNDIALLQLGQPVKFSENIAPICLYPLRNIDNKKLVAIGWGKTESAGDVSPDLQKVDLEYFPNSECQLSYAAISKQDLPRGIVDEIQICAGSRREERDTCQGDSGGPLQFQENGRMYLVGITSFGIGCGKPGNPGVYTRASYYIPWMQNILWGK